MTSGFNDYFTLPQEQWETGFNAASVGTGTDSTPADDGIDHALLQDLLFEVSSAGYHASTTTTGPSLSQNLYNAHGASRFLDNTCNLAMLELNHFPTPAMAAEAGDRNIFAPPASSQPSLRAAAGSFHGFGQGGPLDASAFPLPDLSTDLPEGQPNYGLDGPLGSAGQARVAPSFYAGDQPLARAPAASQPIGYQNTLAQPGRIISASLKGGPPESNTALAPQTIGDESTRALSHTKKHSPIPGHGPGGAQLTPFWEMRNSKYFCLHAGCRNPSFKRLGDLERHQNNVHAQTKFFWWRYDGCGRGRPFPRKDKRNEHERKVHHVNYTLAENV